MKLRSFKNWGALSASACLAVTSAHAITLDVGLTDPYAIGDVILDVDHGFGARGGPTDMTMINLLTGMALNSSAVDTLGGNTYLFNRSGNLNQPISSGATAGGGVTASGSGITFDDNHAQITLDGTGYGYLVAKYGGANGGMEVWNISSLGAGTTLKVPEFAFGQTGGKYGLSSWGLYLPTTPPSSVEDGGTTLLLFGVALSGLGLLRRMLAKQESRSI